MTGVTAEVSSPLAPRRERMFPTLTHEQIARIAPHGKRRKIARGEMLVEAGHATPAFFVVESGALEVVRSSAIGDEVVTTHRRGQFTGEVNLLTGRRGLASIRVIED